MKYLDTDRRGNVQRDGRSQTFRVCDVCKVEFGPLDRLTRIFCSVKCKSIWQTKEKRKPRQKPTVIARNAQRTLRYYIETGRMIRPLKCEECGCSGRKIEAAHHDYSRPLDVRWLCKSCHVKWDRKDPKGGTVRETKTDDTRR